MRDKSQLPFLVQLLDDESRNVRDQVVRELLSYGPDLEAELHRLEDTLSRRQLSVARTILNSYRDIVGLREAWLQWPELDDDVERLERGLQLLAQIQYGWAPPVRLGDLLDDLAAEFLASGLATDPIGLARFLFTRRFRGNTEDYYDPLNSNLIHVLQTGRGLPISLASVFILVANRVGLEVVGCSVPGHFLARGRSQGRHVYFDCFNRGRVLSSSEIDEIRAGLRPHLQHLLTEPASAPAILVRVLHNLINAYTLIEDGEKVELMKELLRDLQGILRAI